MARIFYLASATSDAYSRCERQHREKGNVFPSIYHCCKSPGSLKFVEQRKKILWQKATCMVSPLISNLPEGMQEPSVDFLSFFLILLFLAYFFDCVQSERYFAIQRSCFLFFLGAFIEFLRLSTFWA